MCRECPGPLCLCAVLCVCFLPLKEAHRCVSVHARRKKARRVDVLLARRVGGLRTTRMGGFST